uniref:Aldehyde dehydrogenase domain-containing protein n=1 Tax=Gallus gallus TaxID=9031 RepID=A0A8V0ZQG3_CHICK
MIKIQAGRCCLWAAWPSGRTRPLEYHTAQLEQDILEATALDMHKVREMGVVWGQADGTSGPLTISFLLQAMQLDSAFICKDPYGVVLIIGPWNYPIYLLLVPLIGGGDGNCVVLKPSEISRNMERLVAEALLSYLNKDCFTMVTAGREEITRLLENKFDYIFTGASCGEAQLCFGSTFKARGHKRTRSNSAYTATPAHRQPLSGPSRTSARPCSVPTAGRR